MKDYYKILGVSSNCSQEAIKKAYRKLARDSHPDSCGNEDSSDFRSIQEAYETIGTVAKRKVYDRKLQSEQFQKNQKLPSYSFRFDDYELYAPLSLENWFDRILNNFFQMDSHSPIFADFEQQLELTLTREEAEHGGTYPIKIPIHQTCTLCRGTGSNLFFLCDACQGYGYILNDVTINLQVPPAIRNYSKISIPIQGYGCLNIMVIIH
ncbi:MAG: DnaJ domain-containing protein [bacterium]|jgi:molecular chaperone DnaJ|nr:DnaJ domain-containing protein [bacterium]